MERLNISEGNPKQLSKQSMLGTERPESQKRLPETAKVVHSHELKIGGTIWQIVPPLLLVKSVGHGLLLILHHCLICCSLAFLYNILWCKVSVTKQIKPFLIIAVGLGLVYWFVGSLDWKTVGEHLRNASILPLLLAAVLINMTIFARSLRWREFLAPIAEVKMSNLIAATAIGFGGLFVIGRAAEVLRPTVLSLREKLQPSATFATILIERIYDTVMVVSFFSVCLLFADLPAEQAKSWQKVGGTHTLGLILLTCIICGVIVLVLLRLKSVPIINWIEKQSVRLPRKLAQLLLNFVRHLSDGLGILLDLKKLLITILYTFLVWSLIASATWLTLYAFKLNFSLNHIVFILGFGLVGSVVPTPGGSAGAFHAAAAKALEFLGVEANLAASIAIVYHLIAFGPPFILGLYYLIRHDISFNQLREMIASEGEQRDLTQNQAKS